MANRHLQLNGFSFKKKYLDRINRIVRIMRPAAERSLAAGKKILVIQLILSK